MRLRKLFLSVISICLLLFLIFYIIHIKGVARSEKLQRLSSISKKTLNFKFAVISDPHISVFESSKSPTNEVKMFKDSVSLLESTVKEINKIPDIKFVCVLGDLTKDAEPWNVDKVKEILDRLQVPYYVVLGNHDVSVVDSHLKNMGPSVTRSTMIWTFQGHGFTGPNRWWSLDPLPGVHLIGLDSTMIGDWGGYIDNQQLKFLEKDLQNNKSKFTIVMLHHQLLPYTKAEETGENNFNKFVLYNSEQVREVLEKFPQVAVVLSGHRHISTRYKMEKGIAYFTCASTVTYPMRYTIFEIKDWKLTYTTKDVPCDQKVWEEARKNALNTNINTWPRWSAHPKTPSGDRSLFEELEGPSFQRGFVSLTRLKDIIK